MTTKQELIRSIDKKIDDGCMMEKRIALLALRSEVKRCDCGGWTESPIHHYDWCEVKRNEWWQKREKSDREDEF
jgi:hypothetical protein